MKFAELETVKVGDKVKFEPLNGPYWWNVGARSEKYLICFQQAPFEPKGTMRYCVVADIDYNYNGQGPGLIRTSVATLGGGFDIKEDGSGCEELLQLLEAGETELSNRRLLNIDKITVKNVA